MLKTFYLIKTFTNLLWFISISILFYFNFYFIYKHDERSRQRLCKSSDTIAFSITIH